MFTALNLDKLKTKTITIHPFCYERYAERSVKEAKESVIGQELFLQDIPPLFDTYEKKWYSNPIILTKEILGESLGVTLDTLDDFKKLASNFRAIIESAVLINTTDHTSIWGEHSMTLEYLGAFSTKAVAGSLRRGFTPSMRRGGIPSKDSYRIVLPLKVTVQMDVNGNFTNFCFQLAKEGVSVPQKDWDFSEKPLKMNFVDFVQCLDSKKHAFLLQELPKELLGSSLTESYPPPTEEKAEENIKEGLEAASLE